MNQRLIRTLRRFGKRRRALVLFDFDGTLAPIASTPGKTRLPSADRGLLKRLSKKGEWHVGVVSGRSLRDTERKVAVPGLVYAGNHGLQIAGPGFSFVHPGAAARAGLLRRIARRCRKALGGVPGALVEDKGLTLALHYRLVPPAQRARFKSVCRRLIASAPERDRIHLRQGKKTWGIRPRVSWDKGSAVRWLRARLCPGAPVLYVGDDATDEDVFGSLRKGDISVHVGRNGVSRAEFRISGPGETRALIRRILQ